MYSKGKANFIGAISLLLGIISFILSIISFYLPFLPISGLILGGAHLLINRKYGNSNLGKIGIVLNATALIIYALWTIIPRLIY